MSRKLFRSTQTTNFLSMEQYTTAINNYRSRQLYSARRKLETLRTVSATLPTLAPTTYPTTEPQYYFKKTINRGSYFKNQNQKFFKFTLKTKFCRSVTSAKATTTATTKSKPIQRRPLHRSAN